MLLVQIARGEKLGVEALISVLALAPILWAFTQLIGSAIACLLRGIRAKLKQRRCQLVC